MSIKNKSYAIAAGIGMMAGTALNIPLLWCCFCFVVPFTPVFIGVFDSLVNKFSTTQSNQAFVSAMKAGAIGGLTFSIAMLVFNLIKVTLGLTIELAQSASEFDFAAASYSWTIIVFGILMCSSISLVYFVVVSGISGLVTASFSKKSS